MTHLSWILAALFTLLSVVRVAPAAENLLQPPQRIPEGWLPAGESPRIFSTAAQLREIRRTLDQTPWRKKYLEDRKKLVDRFVEMSDEQLRSLVPPPGSLFAMGLGMNLDPVHHEKMVWGGWDRPHVMLDSRGVAYPNEQWPDQGQGIKDPETGGMYYFVAQANGKITQNLEPVILPALADVWALSGDPKYAHAAAVLLDAVAAVYPTNRRGPLDYPTSAGDMDRGGRLDNSYYTVARGLMNFAFVIDMIADSGELNKPSAYGGQQSMRENIVRNLLWDGANYCLDFARRNYALHNGQMDYERGAAVVGALLNVREFAEPMLSGPMSFFHMLSNNIGPDGYYVESAAMYANWTGGLYITAAELMHAMRRDGWKDVADPYTNPTLVRFLSRSFDRQEVGGHVPMLGDSGPDAAVVDPLRRYPDPPRVYNDRFLDFQLNGAWLLLARGVRKAEMSQLLCDTYGDRPIVPPQSQWFIYNITDKEIGAVKAHQPDPANFETQSVAYGIRGLALLRGGKARERHGAQLLFGIINGHGHEEALTWTFFARGAEWSYDPGYFNAHYRFGWTEQAVGHQAMTVNMASADVGMDDRKLEKEGSTGGGGTGRLLSWHSGPTVQWAMASHVQAYRAQGVTQYERLIAQTQDEDGKLAYWLDIGRVAGGKMRDDSFHSRMCKASYSVELPAPDPRRPALYGDRDLGKLLQPDLRLKGFEDKPFYWWAPGDGYGFLGEPRELAMPESVRVVMTDPAWKDMYPGVGDPVMVVDLSGGPGRQLIVTHAPKAPQDNLSVPVPYILRRDTGSGASTFAKVVRLADTEALDPIASLTQLEARSQQVGGAGRAPATAWMVSWKNGRRDIWVVADPSADGMVEVSGAGIPALRTNGRVTQVELSAAGDVVRVMATEASEVRVEGGPELTGAGTLQGSITSIDPSTSPARLEVKWRVPPQASIAAGDLLVTRSPSTQATTWSIASIDPSGVTLNQVTPSIAATNLIPVPDKAGWYAVETPISRFVVPGGFQSQVYAQGRVVYAGSRPVGRIAEMSDDGREIRLNLFDKTWASKTIEAKILLAAPDDEVIIPLELSMDKTDR